MDLESVSGFAWQLIDANIVFLYRIDDFFRRGLRVIVGEIVCALVLQLDFDQENGIVADKYLRPPEVDCWIEDV